MEYCFVYQGVSEGLHTYKDELSSLVITIPDKNPLPPDYLDTHFTASFKEILTNAT